MVCVGIFPSEFVVPLNRLNALESLMITCTPFNGLVPSSTLTSKNHFTVRLSTCLRVPTSGANATLLLLKLTFKKVISVTFAVKTIS